ncbi:hypothetical protein SAMN04487917_101185 [Arthrobacter sp. yr096]|uniref:hypothetical protein n=1 Tax=Arthrobacter sp. yr096 TaxID=1761750 RepID=UPI0008AE86F2|nr:hypothetical protein [Arthrobacter sp. yr096]SEI42072.1 hypothetical protein SAMN04487917_101185 [Arthrobacter sp. yr096]
MRLQKIDTSANVVTHFPDVETFLAAESIPVGILSINEQGIPIDILNSDVGADVTIVFFHGAIEPTHNLPVLSGQGISGGLIANRIFISDPSLYLTDKLALAWFAGNSKQPLQKLLPQVIGRIIRQHGAQRVIFFGGSGGGYASMYYSSVTPGSLAIAFNPQTKVTRYINRSVRAFATHAFGISEDEYDPIAEIPNTPVLDLCAVYGQPVDNTVLYIQNTNDTFHIERHMEPFLAVNHPDNKLHVMMDSWAPGHTPPPKTILAGFLARMTSPEPWEESIPDVIREFSEEPSSEVPISSNV